MKLIYLHLYKATYLIFMQAYKPYQRTLDYSKSINFTKLKVINNSKIRLLHTD